MPGHKGESFTGYEKYDLTEINGADSLFEADGIIMESEENASRLFGCYTFYSTEGSSLSIRAMLCLATRGRKNPLILAGRNAHKTFLTASALLDFDVKWIYPRGNGSASFGNNEKSEAASGFDSGKTETASFGNNEKAEAASGFDSGKTETAYSDVGSEYASYLSCNITAEQVEREILALSQKPAAVYLTSPDYLGNILDIESISAVCRKYGVLLLVDNAHGAYLKFLKPSVHPMDLGADMCCDSAHKTLPTLTGGGYLHVSTRYAEENYGTNQSFTVVGSNANQSFTADGSNAKESFTAVGSNANQYDSNLKNRKYISSIVKESMSIFASTSPSYLILQSLDLTNEYLCEFPRILEKYIPKVENFKKRLSEMGYIIIGKEPLKVTLCGKRLGYTGVELGKILEENNIYPEFYDKDFLVMMFTPQIDCFEVLENIFGKVASNPVNKAESEQEHKGNIYPKRAMSPREALLSQKELVNVEDAAGRILASPSVGCPPAVPIAVCGEIIDENIIEQFKLYGVEKCFVVSLNNKTQ